MDAGHVVLFHFVFEMSNQIQAILSVLLFLQMRDELTNENTFSTGVSKSKVGYHD